jgi:hypothetical protein
MLRRSVGAEQMMNPILQKVMRIATGLSLVLCMFTAITVLVITATPSCVSNSMGFGFAVWPFMIIALAAFLFTIGCTIMYLLGKLNNWNSRVRLLSYAATAAAVTVGVMVLYYVGYIQPHRGNHKCNLTSWSP